MYEIPTMDDWFRLVRKYPEYKQLTGGNLKDYGYMKCIEFIETNCSKKRPARILEFGHGRRVDIMSRFQQQHEVWGADRYQELHYQTFDWEAEFNKKVAPYCQKVHFVRTLVGLDEQSSKTLPENYFDVICSVSVLEEIPIPTVDRILEHANRLLRPGDWIIGTHDLHLAGAPKRLPAYFDVHHRLNLQIEQLPEAMNFDANKLLLEQPTVVMLWFDSWEPEETRTWHGHYSTIFTAAQKPMLAK